MVIVIIQIQNNVINAYIFPAVKEMHTQYEQPNYRRSTW